MYKFGDGSLLQNHFPLFLQFVTENIHIITDTQKFSSTPSMDFKAFRVNFGYNVKFVVSERESV